MVIGEKGSVTHTFRSRNATDLSPAVILRSRSCGTAYTMVLKRRGTPLGSIQRSHPPGTTIQCESAVCGLRWLQRSVAAVCDPPNQARDGSQGSNHYSVDERSAVEPVGSNVQQSSRNGLRTDEMFRASRGKEVGQRTVDPRLCVPDQNRSRTKSRNGAAMR